MEPAERLPPQDDGSHADADPANAPDPAAPLDATLLSVGLDPARHARLERLLTQSMDELLPAIEELAS